MESIGEDHPSCADIVIEADADIVGPGVLVAFFISAVITIAAVVVGYLSGSLCNEFMTDVDREIIEWSATTAKQFWGFIWPIRAQRVFRCTRLKLGAGPSQASDPPMTSNLEKDDQSSNGRKLEARKQAFTQFILTLSDQQLVTGLAILIAGLSTWDNDKRISKYELQVLSSLALFSSTTHMATLSALRTYFKNHRSLRNIRVCGMIAVPVLVVVCSVIPTSDPTCQRTDPEGRTWKTRLNNLYERQDLVEKLCGSLPLCILVLGYALRILDLYRSHGWWRNPTPNTIIELLPTASTISRDQYIQVSRVIARTTILRCSLSMPSCIQKYFASILLIDCTFLSCLLGVTFSFSYGTSKVVFRRWYYTPNIDAETNSMGFGQIVAMFLLFLPFMAAGEAYIDYRDNRYPSKDISTEPRETHHQGLDLSPDTLNPSDSSQGDLRGRTTRPGDNTELQLTSGELEYNQHSQDIVNYLPWDVYHIQHLESLQTTATSRILHSVGLQKKKEETATEYKRLRGLEDQVTLKFKLGAFGFMLFMCATAGVLLNMGPVNIRSRNNRSYFGAFVITFATLSGMPFAVPFIITIYRKRCIVKIRSGKNEANGQDAAGDNRATGVSIIDLESMPRRTATGLLEEGPARLQSPY